MRPKRRCPKCGYRKGTCQFKRNENPDGWCNKCRNKSARVSVLSSEPEPSASLVAEIKLGKTKVLRVRVLGGMVALTSGQIEERKVRETTQMPGGDLNHKWHVTRTADSFISDCSTLTVPLRLLSELRAVLARVARAHPRLE